MGFVLGKTLAILYLEGDTYLMVPDGILSAPYRLMVYFSSCRYLSELYGVFGEVFYYMELVLPKR